MPYTKYSQEQANYTEVSQTGFICGNCKFFRPPIACNVVEGDINYKGWCKFWIEKPIDEPAPTKLVLGKGGGY